MERQFGEAAFARTELGMLHQKLSHRIVKWIVFALGLVSIFPIARWLRGNPRQISKVWTLGELPFLVGAMAPGNARGSCRAGCRLCEALS